MKHLFEYTLTIQSQCYLHISNSQLTKQSDVIHVIHFHFDFMNI